VAQQWIDTLRQERVAGQPLSRRDYLRLVHFPRWWKRVFDLRQLSPSDRILEVGCGSGHQLIPFAAQGFRATGLDVSPDAIEQCHSLVSEVERILGRGVSINLLLGDFAQMDVSEQFPLVFTFGVIEHFLEHTERIQFLHRLAEWTIPGGACVNCVPNGMQPFRQLMRSGKLGGYNIPEIDYDSARLKEDMREAGFERTRVVPLDLFGYRLVLTPRSSSSWYVFRALNLFFKLIPDRFLSLRFRERHAYVLSGVARKPLE
jgi:SAM-dependent methyltransferase